MRSYVKILKDAARRITSEQHLPPDPLLEYKQTEATKQARAMGLEYLGFGRWGLRGRATHIENDDRTALILLKKPEKIVSSKRLRNKNLDVMTTIISMERPEGLSDTVATKFSNVKHAFKSVLKPSYDYDYDNDTEKVTGYRATRYLPLNRYDIDKLVQDSHNQYESLDYDERTAVSAYTGSAYETINETLRTMAKIKQLKKKFDGEINPEEKERISKEIKALVNNKMARDPSYHDYIRGLSSAFKRFKFGQDLVVYRGVSELERAQMKKGEIFDVQQYISTTIDPAFAKSWKDGSMLILRVPKKSHGIFVAGYSNHAHESEVLLDRGMQIKIRHIKPSIPRWLRTHLVSKIQLNKGDQTYKPTESELSELAEREGRSVPVKVFGEIVGLKKAVTDNDVKDFIAFKNRQYKRSKEEIEQEKLEMEAKKEMANPTTPPGTAFYKKAKVSLEKWPFVNKPITNFSEENLEFAKIVTIPNDHLFFDLNNLENPLVTRKESTPSIQVAEYYPIEDSKYELQKAHISVLSDGEAPFKPYSDLSDVKFMEQMAKHKLISIGRPNWTNILRINAEHIDFSERQKILDIASKYAKATKLKIKIYLAPNPNDKQSWNDEFVADSDGTIKDLGI